MPHLIGISLGFCIKDILDEEILEKDVKYIISNTACQTEEEWEALEKDCLRVHWNNDTRGLDIMRRLKNQNKILQPRLSDPKFHTNLNSGRWFINIVGKEMEEEKIPSCGFGFSWIYGPDKGKIL